MRYIIRKSICECLSFNAVIYLMWCLAWHWHQCLICWLNKIARYQNNIFTRVNGSKLVLDSQTDRRTTQAGRQTGRQKNDFIAVCYSSPLIISYKTETLAYIFGSCAGIAHKDFIDFWQLNVSTILIHVDWEDYAEQISWKPNTNCLVNCRGK